MFGIHYILSFYIFIAFFLSRLKGKNIKYACAGTSKSKKSVVERIHDLHLLQRSLNFKEQSNDVVSILKHVTHEGEFYLKVLNRLFAVYKTGHFGAFLAYYCFYTMLSIYIIFRIKFAYLMDFLFQTVIFSIIYLSFQL